MSVQTCIAVDVMFNHSRAAVIKIKLCKLALVFFFVLITLSAAYPPDLFPTFLKLRQRLV